MLVIYKYMLDRWWGATLTLGIFLLIIAGGLGGFPLLFPELQFPRISNLALWVVVCAGVFVVSFSFFLITLRKSAFVQPFSDHLRLVTPFLRLNFSYRRIRRTYTAEMQQLFPWKKTSLRRRQMIRPLASKILVVIEMTSFPAPPAAMHLFLSPFFFPDKTPRLALLVPDWIAFSTEMESLRSAWQDSLRPALGNQAPQQSSTTNKDKQ
jgi:hypothetical protein